MLARQVLYHLSQSTSPGSIPWAQEFKNSLSHTARPVSKKKFSLYFPITNNLTRNLGKQFHLE
jgi:hypothetical protein